MGNPIDALFKLITKNDLWEGSQEYQRNEFLIEQGKTNTHLFYVVSGRLRLKLCDLLRVVIFHNERHFIQIARILEVQENRVEI